MATTSIGFVHLGGPKVNLGGSVLDNLKTLKKRDRQTATFLNDTLNTALKAKLAAAATNAGYQDLAALVQAIPSVDIAASKGLSVQDFVTQRVKLPTDPKAKAAIKAEIAKLTTTTTVSDLLGLATAVNANPLLANEVKRAEVQAVLNASTTLAANPKMIDDFINRYANSTSTISDFWSQLTQDPEFKAAVPELQLTLQLGTLTLNNPALVTALRTQYQPKSPQDLTKLGVNDWTQLVTSKSISVPASIPGSTPADKVANYVSVIIGSLQAAFPTDYIATTLKTRTDSASSAGQFLIDHPDVNLLTTNIDAYIQQNKLTVASTVVDPLKTVARLARISSDPAVVSSMLDAGLGSAHQIASTARASFMQQYAVQLGGTEQATALYNQAQHIAAKNLNLFANVRHALTLPPIRAIGSVAEELTTALSSPAAGPPAAAVPPGPAPLVLPNGSAVDALITAPSAPAPSAPANGFPDWPSLFGSLSYCTCEDCRSVYSAAAYFVDLLQFLKSSAPTKGYTPYDVLIGGSSNPKNYPQPQPGRRPDLPYIKLNCQNTNTPLPYVDLVNEILESFVVLNGKLDETTAHDTSKDATADELSVNPEYTKDEAYTILGSSATVYPPTLPFDRWLETARTYLEFMGTSLCEVMTTFQNGADPTDLTQGTPTGIALACEYLKVSEAECIILTGLDFSGGAPAGAHQLYEYYGYAAAAVSPVVTWEQDVSQVNSFLQRMQITYDDLVALVQTRFLNPTQSIVLLSPADAPCDLTQTTIVDLSVAAPAPAPSGTMGGPPPGATLDRMHRFIRLWRKIGWSIPELDKALTALNLSDFTSDATKKEYPIVSVALVKQLQSILNLPLVTLLSFWNNIDTDGRDSLYLQLFQNKAVLNPPDSAFQLLYTAPLKALPTLSFPCPLFPNLTYAAGQLTLTGSIGPDEQGQLTQDASLTDPNYAAYVTAITSLANQSKAGGGLTYSTALAALPAPTLTPFVFLAYDPAKGQISVIGAMSDGSRAALNFSTDTAYQTAVDQLYQMRTLTVADVAAPDLLPNHANAILAALHISATDLNALTSYLASKITTALNLSNLSTLFRYALLARTLGVSVGDLLSLVTLAGVDPFSDPATSLSFVQQVQKVQASPFSVTQLNYLYRDLYDPNAGIAPLPANVSLLLTTLQAGLAKIAQDNVVVLDPKGDLLRKKLATLLGSSAADAAVGLINGTGIYSVPLALLPGMVLPAFVTYSAAAQQLSISGAMSAAQEAQLLALSPDPNYQGVIVSLYTSSQAGGAAVYIQPLAALPAIPFPILPSGAISYDSVGQQLSFTGPMTAADQTALLALSSDPGYQAAVNSIYAASLAGAPGPGGVYYAPLAALPAIAFPNLPGGAVLYDSAAQQLRLTGPMTTADQTALLALSADPNYQAAIQNLYQQPRDFISANFGPFLLPSDGVAHLIENPQLTSAEKIDYVMQGLMPYLRQSLSESLIKQTLSNNLQLDAKVTALLLGTVLNSQVSSAKAKAMADFLALVGDGLSASYYSTQDLTGAPVLTRVDPTVDFNWGFGLTDAPVAAAPFSADWKGWIMPQYSEAYTLYVRAGDGVRLWVNDGVTNQLLIDQWKDQAPTEHVSSSTIALTAGELYQVELQYYDHTASATVNLSWSSPSTPKAIVPQAQLFSGASFSSLTPISSSYTLLYKASLLVNTLQATVDDLTYLFNNSSQFANLDFNRLPLNRAADPAGTDTRAAVFFGQWERLNALFGLRNTIPGGDTELLNVFSTASNAAKALTDTISAVATATAWDPAEIGILVTAFALSNANFTNEVGFTKDATNGIGLVRLQACMALVGRIGVSSHQLFAWAGLGPGTGPNPLAGEENVAQDIRNAVKTKYDDTTWVTVGKPLNDKIREASKEALIGYILAKASAWGMTAPDPGGGPITTSDQLYEYFLIDVDMSPCMLTSRIVQANAAIQLFVQRCLMNLEPAVSPSVFDTSHWDWMENYRVWEANRMVFLYPENWMQPELRDDKTPFFQDLENELLQNDVTVDTVEQAYLNYLNKLDEVARLDIRGTYWQFDSDDATSSVDALPGTNDVLHVFARTFASPYTYYYRQLLNCSKYGTPGGGSIWTPWEKVDVSIEGDHLIPVMWNRRLYLFWPIFKETADPGNNLPQPAMANSNYTPSPTQKRLEVRLAWSEYWQGKWSAKQVSADPPLVPKGYSGYPSAASRYPTDNSGQLDTSQFVFNSSIDETGALWISVYSTIYVADIGPTSSGGSVAALSGSALGEIGTFEFSGCNSSPQGTPGSGAPQFPVAPENSKCSGMSLVEVNAVPALAGTLTLVVPDAAPVQGIQEIPTLAATPTPYNLLFPQQFFPKFNLQAQSPFTDQPFFYQDSLRSYFVTERHPDPSVQFTDVNQLNALYSPEQLAAVSQSTLVAGPSLFGQASVSVQPAAAKVVLAARQTDLTVAHAAPAPPGAPPAPPGQPPGGGSAGGGDAGGAVFAGEAEVTKQLAIMLWVTFDTHYHPLACALIKVLNRYGVPGLLTLVNQQITNDGAVISGFVLSPSPTSIPGITAGALYAQGQLYAPLTAPVLPPAPANQISFLFYNSSTRFYYSLALMPSSPGDALIGSVRTAGGTVTSVQSSSAFPPPTVFQETYMPTARVASPYPLENLDFSFGGPYSIYNWELFFDIPLLIATRLSQNQQFEDATKWLEYIFNPTTNSSDPIPQRYWNFLPFYECSPWDEIYGQIQNVLQPPASSSTGTPPSECGQGISDQISFWENDPFQPFAIARLRTVAYRMKVVMAYIDNLIAWGDYLFSQNTRESINEATQLYVLAQEILGPSPAEIPQRGTVQDYTYNDLVTLYSIDKFSNAQVQMENDFPFVTASSTASSSGLGSVLSMVTVALYFCIPPNDQLLGYWNTVDDRLYKIRNCMNIAGQVEQLALFAPPISPALLVQAQALGVDLSSVLNDINAGAPNYRFTYMIQKALELCAEVRSLGAALLSALEKKDGEALSLLRATQEASLLKAMAQMKQWQVDESNANLQALQNGRAATSLRQSYYQGLVSAGLSSYERQQINELSTAETFQQLSQVAELYASEVALLPNVQTGVAGVGGTAVAAVTYGSAQIEAAASAVSRALNMFGSVHTYNANMAAVLGGWDRRAQDWGFQAQTATLELAQIDQQIAAASLRVQIAQDDLNNHNLQIQNAQEVRDFLRNKYTDQDLYSWMVDQTSTIFFQCYQMAYSLAKRAEAAFQFDLGLPDSTFIQFGYWDSLKKGLLSGERLYLDLKRLELAYLEQNVRQYEITKYVSLVLFDPMALIALKETGHCVVSLPEAFFDMDYPGHYMRRIQTFIVTIPSVVPPYASVNCTLTLAQSKIRVDNAASSIQDYASDSHFVTNYAATQSIATSTAQNDSGMFEVNFGDPQYLPFEGAGLISTWQIDMPRDCNAFDFETISDVVLMLRYKARYGGDKLRDIAKQAAVLPPRSLQVAGATPALALKQPNMLCPFSLKHQFPSEWSKFFNPVDTASSQSMQLNLTMDRFPFPFRGRTIQVTQVDLFLKFKDTYPLPPPDPSNPPQDVFGKANAMLPVHIISTSGNSYTVVLKADTSLNGIPDGSMSVTETVGSSTTWTIQANDADIGSLPTSFYNSPTDAGGVKHYRLRSDVIQDIVMVCRYSVL